MNKGTIVVDEIPIPVKDIYLDKGLIWIIAEKRGPVRAVNADGYVLCDRQGAVVYRVDHGIPGLKWRKVGHLGTLEVVVPIGITGRVADPAPPGAHPDMWVESQGFGP